MCQAAGWQGTGAARQERAIPGHGKVVLPAAGGEKRAPCLLISFVFDKGVGSGSSVVLNHICSSASVSPRMVCCWC